MGLVKEAVLNLKITGIAEAEQQALRFYEDLNQAGRVAAQVSVEAGKLKTETAAAADQAERYSAGMSGGHGGGFNLHKIARAGRFAIGAASAFAGGESILGEAASGALEGAALGSVAGPAGELIGAVVGAIGKGFAAVNKDHSEAAKELKEAASAHRDAAHALNDSAWYAGRSESVDYLGR